MRIDRSFVLAGAFIALAAVAPWTGVWADPLEGDRAAEPRDSRCRLAGLYVGAIPGQASFTMTNTPLDPRAREVMLTIDTTGYGPTLDGLFPTAVGQTLLRGFVTRQGPNRYAGQLVRYRYDAARAVVGTELQALEVSVPACDRVEISFLARLFYFGFVNAGEARLPEPDIRFDVAGAPPTAAIRMQPYAANAPHL